MDGVLNEKSPGGAEAQAKLLRKEGIRVAGKGRTLRVEGDEAFLAGRFRP